MKKSLIIAAMAVFAMASCSKDQVVDVQKNEISYSVVTDNATKAEAVYCANNLMSSFTVYAQTNAGAAYIMGDVVESTDGSTWTNKSGSTRYWPEIGTLDFYAIVNGEMAFTPSTETTAEVGKIASFTPATEVAKQVDLLYAVDVDKAKAGAQAVLNFRHALSQIEFQAKNMNKNLYVEITNVKVGNVYKTGSYVLPNAATTVKFVDHTQATNVTDLTRGAWTFGEDKESYTVGVTTNGSGLLNTSTAVAAVPYNESAVVALTTSTDASDDTRDFGKSMLLLPTVNIADADGLEAWDGTKETLENGGAYIGVECTFYNVATSGADPAADNITEIQSTWAYLPVNIKWEEGKKYIYTFIFTTNGDGGKDPEGDDVLTPIQYTVTVDDFEKGSTDEVEMNVQ